MKRYSSTDSFGGRSSPMNFSDNSGSRGDDMKLDRLVALEKVSSKKGGDVSPSKSDGVTWRATQRRRTEQSYQDARAERGLGVFYK